MRKLCIFLLAFILVIQVYLMSSKNIFSIYYDSYSNNFIEKKDNIDESNLISAKVVDNYNGLIRDIFLINKGKLDNIKENSFVINSEGLVGQVVKTYDHYSVVRSIFSHKTKIAIETNGCYGTLGVEYNGFVIDDLINCDDINVNDAVFTSKYNYSLSNIFIGSIYKIKSHQLYIKPSVNKYKIHNVGVIIDDL